MLPWVHLNVQPNGNILPCCIANDVIGNANDQSLKEVWNLPYMNNLRESMLNDKPSSTCSKCYDAEARGAESSRMRYNKEFGHHITKIDTTPFELVYWDSRFSNVCNLKCRSCGHDASSSWYRDTIKIYPEYNKPVIISAGKDGSLLDQMMEHIDKVESIYFAGGEPILIKDNYKIFDELDRLGKYDVKLYFVTNFTNLEYKGKSIFQFLNKFTNVTIAASLDGMGKCAEYIRSGTVWAEVEESRKLMKEQAPNVKFMLTPALSILNAWHLPDFHRDWIEKKLVGPNALHISTVYHPSYLRADIATPEFKEQLKEKYTTHIEWLKTFDNADNSVRLFNSARSFITGIDNSHLLKLFWLKTAQLDKLRNENVLDIFPELICLKK